MNYIVKDSFFKIKYIDSYLISFVLSGIMVRVITKN